MDSTKVIVNAMTAYIMVMLTVTVNVDIESKSTSARERKVCVKESVCEGRLRFCDKNLYRSATFASKWKSWKKRWFHLNADTALLKLHLALVTNMSRGDTVKEGCCIELDTHDRTWVLAALSEENRAVWLDKLKQAIDAHIARRQSQHLPDQAYPVISYRPSASLLATLASQPSQRSPTLDQIETTPAAADAAGRLEGPARVA